MTHFKKACSIFGVICAVLLFTLGTGAAESLGERLAGKPAGDDNRALVQFLNDGFRSGQSEVPVVVTRKPIDPRDWDKWKANGVSYAVNLKSDAWILRVAVSKDKAANVRMASYLKSAVGADKAFPYVAAYKTSVDLLAGKFHYDKLRKDGDANITVEFFADTPQSDAERIVAEFQSGQERGEHIGGSMWALRIDPKRIGALASFNQVYVVDEKVPPLPLSNEMRAITHVDDAQNMNWTNTSNPPVYDLSGRGIRMSNWEGLSTTHPDFKLDPADTAPRWAGCGSDNQHGAMTAGLMLGDGSGSVAGGANSPYKWRGVAPNATYVCYSSAAGTGQPDVANFSFVESFGPYDSGVRYDDAETRGAYGPILRIPHVRSAGNNGLHPPQYDTVSGYYSMLGPSKNTIVVGNVDALDLRWQNTGSSLGPTFDNRIRPDVVAPGTIVSYAGPASGIDFDIESVKVMKSSLPVVNWTFSPANGFYGWGQNLNPINDSWWTRANFTLSLETTACGPGSSNCLHAHMDASPFTQGYRHGPYLATFARPNPVLPEDLYITPSASDSVEIRYRITTVLERDIVMNLFFGNQDIANPADNNNYYTMSDHYFPVISDGQWHTATIPIGTDPNWTAKPFINHVGLSYEGDAQILHAPTIGGTVYQGAGGTSAAAPVVAGVVALMLEKITKPPLNVVLASHTAWSPYFRAAPATGAPLPSTLKAILIHTAHDLAYEPHVSDTPNFDTNALQTYHRGPDFVTGYGLVDAKAAVDLIDLDENALPGAKNIYEDQFTTSDILPPNSTPPCSNSCPWGYRQYTRNVPAGRMLPLKVTLAYDDVEGADNPDPAVQVSPRLVNDIDLELISPSGQRFRPWTIDPPYVPASLPAGYQGNIEPQPIPASAIHRARRDQINDRDNVKQVVVDLPEAGAWQIVVGMNAYGAPPPQPFSLVIDGAVAPPAPNLNGGKIVYSSSMPGLFGSTLQLFVTNVGSGTETQITNGPTNAQDPSWSYDGNHIVHITDGGWKLIWIHIIWNIWLPWFTWQPESIDIRDPAGNLQASYQTAALTGMDHGKYPDWSPDGSHIVVTTFDIWGTLELRLINFSAPYNFASPTTSVLVPTNFAGNSEDPADGEYSRNGNFVYFGASSNADTGRVYKVNVATGLVEQIFGDGVPIRRAYAVSISPDGSTLIYNSDLYKENVPNQIDEELLSVGLLTGTIAQLTHTSGDQYGRFAKNGVGQEFLFASYSTPQSPHDLFLSENGTITAALTSAHREEGGADWVK